MAIDAKRRHLAVRRRLNIEQVPRVNYRLCVKRKSEARQILRDQYAEARVIDRKPSAERVDGEDRRLRRKSENGLYVRAATDVRFELAEKCLEIIIRKNGRRVRDIFGGKFLSLAETVTRGHAEPPAQSACVNEPKALCAALLFADEFGYFAAHRIKRHLRQARSEER